MLKSDLVAAVAAGCKAGRGRVARAVDVIFAEIALALCRGERVEIRGLGSFHARWRQSYNGRNPKTGEVISIKEKWVVSFHPSRRWRR